LVPRSCSQSRQMLALLWLRSHRGALKMRVEPAFLFDLDGTLVAFGGRGVSWLQLRFNQWTLN
jgi:hypothetical protein